MCLQEMVCTVSETLAGLSQEKDIADRNYSYVMSE